MLKLPFKFWKKKYFFNTRNWLVLMGKLKAFVDAVGCRINQLLAVRIENPPNNELSLHELIIVKDINYKVRIFWVMEEA